MRSVRTRERNEINCMRARSRRVISLVCAFVLHYTTHFTKHYPQPTNSTPALFFPRLPHLPIFPFLGKFLSSFFFPHNTHTAEKRESSSSSERERGGSRPPHRHRSPSSQPGPSPPAAFITAAHWSSPPTGSPPVAITTSWTRHQPNSPSPPISRGFKIYFCSKW